MARSKDGGLSLREDERPLRFALTFRKSASRVLNNWAADLRRKGHPDEDASLYETAADAARLGMPFIVRGTEQHAQRIADLFRLTGAARPVVAPVYTPRG